MKSQDLAKLKESIEMDYQDSDLDISTEENPHDELEEFNSKVPEANSSENINTNNAIANTFLLIVDNSFSNEGIPAFSNEGIPDPPSETLPGIREGTSFYHDGRGYYYDKDKICGTRRLLKCVRICKKPKCRARATMRNEEGSPIYATGLHNHPPDLNFKEQRLAIHNLKQRIRMEPDKSINEILEEESTNVNIQKILTDPRETENLRRTLKREKLKVTRQEEQRRLKEQDTPDEELVYFG
ncbi:uncharacterized protein LOC129003815 [Macrosteles quadrilineatus]|uniref:uncharacterized protein LOC129003815 n=1 Tax=Macrosteles quadrilineatus TaxID=74068 RepID=UPI0023E1277D|nr:uncharacterized protein LOC129003815 [Macrosteles quadrilineatus]